jgi:xylulokinase
MQKTYIGIDIGTTSIKLAVVDHHMNIVHDVQYMYDYLTPHKEWKEIDPDTWYNIVLQGLEQTLDHIDCASIAGIGITGQMHTTVFVDKHGLSVRPAIMWNDARTKKMIPNIKEKLVTSPQAAHIAKIVSTGSPLANLLWVKEKEPDHYKKIDKILITKDYLTFKLTGNYSTDYCDASTSSLYDLDEDKWSSEVQSLFGFDEKLFPEINFSSKVIGYLSKELQEQFQLNQKIPIIAGTGDNVASAIAVGCFEKNQPLISLGTSGVVVVPNRYHQLKETGKNVVAKIEKEDNTIITQGTVQAGAKVNSWWLEKILKTEHFTEEQSNISNDLLGKNDVIFSPHLNGEKTIYACPDFRGAFVGLSLETTREEMYLAVLEGLAFGIRRLFELMRNQENPKYFTIVGGGAKSNLWIQVFANVLNTPIRLIKNTQGAVSGAATLAIIGVEGDFPRTRADIEMIYPTDKIAFGYEKRYQKYLKLSELMLKFTEGGASDETMLNL